MFLQCAHRVLTMNFISYQVGYSPCIEDDRTLAMIEVSVSKLSSDTAGISATVFMIMNLIIVSTSHLNIPRPLTPHQRHYIPNNSSQESRYACVVILGYVSLQLILVHSATIKHLWLIHFHSAAFRLGYTGSPRDIFTDNVGRHIDFGLRRSLRLIYRVHLVVLIKMSNLTIDSCECHGRT